MTQKYTRHKKPTCASSVFRAELNWSTTFLNDQADLRRFLRIARKAELFG